MSGRTALAVTAALVLACLVSVHPAPARAAAPNGSWTEYHNDDGRAGYDATAPALNNPSAGWVSPTLDDAVYAEPLVANGLVFAATLSNTVYALDQATGAVVWSTHLGTPTSGGWSCGNVSPQGILGTPVIDLGANRIYVAAFFDDATEGTHVYRVIALSLTDGSKVMDTALSIPGFDWTKQQERGALALHSGNVYVPFGGRDGDCGPYHGYVVAVPIAGGANLTPFQTDGDGNSIWAAGGVVVDDATGNLFVATGQGACNVGQNDEVIRLSSTTAFQDYFMPNDWATTYCGGTDQDLGSASPVLLSANLLFEAGKAGGGFLLDPNNLGGVDGQLFPTPKPAAYVQADVCLGNHSDATFGSFAYAAPFVYVECNGHGLVALNVDTSTRSFVPCGSGCGAPDWSAGGTTTFGPPIVAGGAVWAISTGGGGLYAFDAATGAQLLHSAGFVTNHFVTPSEAGGQVFVPADTVIRSFNMASAGVSFTPTHLDFNGQTPNTTSLPQTVTLHNNQGTALSVTSATITGANAADYVKGTDACSGTSVAIGGTCTVQVSFKPGALGGFPASLTFVDGAASSPQSVPLNGLGALDNQSHLYTLDRWGGLHPDGTAPSLATTAYWPGWNIARGVALFPDGTGGYVLDGWGGLHQFGSAAAVGGVQYWPGWDIARGVTLAPWATAANPAGWTLDGWGGLHAFGGAPAFGGFAYWPGWDIARGLVILADSTPGSVSGYTLDGWGGVHPFGSAPSVNNFAYFPGSDFVHSLTLTPNASKANPAGWTLDGNGGVHPFGNAPAVATSGAWPGWDIARAIVAWSGSGVGGWVMDAWGGLHPYGAAPTVSPFAYWPGWYIAASLSGAAFSTGARSAP